MRPPVPFRPSKQHCPVALVSVYVYVRTTLKHTHTLQSVSAAKRASLLPWLDGAIWGDWGCVR